MIEKSIIHLSTHVLIGKYKQASGIGFCPLILILAPFFYVSSLGQTIFRRVASEGRNRRKFEVSRPSKYNYGFPPLGFKAYKRPLVTVFE